MIITPFVISSGVYSLPSLRYANEDRVEKNIETIFRNISREKKYPEKIISRYCKKFHEQNLEKIYDVKGTRKIRRKRYKKNIWETLFDEICKEL